jgi:hypothetical protein
MRTHREKNQWPESSIGIRGTLQQRDFLLASISLCTIFILRKASIGSGSAELRQWVAEG